MSKSGAKFYDEHGVRSDWIDLRDQKYVPSLSVLPNRFSIDPSLQIDIPQTVLRKPVFGVRRQRGDGRCVGYALANLIDIQRSLANAPNTVDDIISADMLYMMAFFHDRYPEAESRFEDTEGIRTLRSAIKGFYHHGACPDQPDATAPKDPHRWQSIGYHDTSDDRDRRFPSVEQAKKAREITLGAYYRVASILNHFHSAVNEAGAILTTANIHDGWWDVSSKCQGIIKWPPNVGKTGTHAFVVTGYDERGFHVLNSWGEEWGGYQNQAGIALWSYSDWARNVVDSWILRLGVFAPSAFDASIGQHGTKGISEPAGSGSVPCYELVGHYMHLDDGYHVETSSYPSFKKDWSVTAQHLTKHLASASPAEDSSCYNGLLLWISGSFEGIKPAFSAAVERKKPIKKLGLYPYNIFWCHSIADQSMDMFQALFKESEDQTGGNADHLDDLIESRVHGLGRAIWRDIELCARHAVSGPRESPPKPSEMEGIRSEIGRVGTIIAELIELKLHNDCQLHVVAEGAGALVVHEILALFGEGEGETSLRDCKAIDCIDTLHLIHPAIDMQRANERLLPFIDKMNGRIEGDRKRASRSKQPIVQPLIDSKVNPRARIYVPTADLQDRMHFGTYSKSVLHLVSRSFEDRVAGSSVVTGTSKNMPRAFLGMTETVMDEDFGPKGAVYLLNRFAALEHEAEPERRSTLNNDPTVAASIFTSIADYQKS